MRDQIKLILPTSWKSSKAAFLAKLGVSSGGLGEHFFGGVYDAFFTYAVDAKSEFERYYSVEYASLADYMEIRYGEVLSDEDLGHDHVYLVTWIPQVVDEDYDNNKFDVVFECIRELERSQNEDQT
ncbi:hypothetical protein K3555_16630 [Leisingera sp. M527]|uniref:hypothetical protein n=1 Tax=Leisingera sp. M527 TaxID=2867014 RepID=UPI0021A87AC5|nr:hypothetical protein [Leisingera sp. M527]UWQ32174.1 hypothetical protein K3555_16630 [Leisingera sp. M527]